MTKTAGRPPRSEQAILEFQSKIANYALAIYRTEGFRAISMRRLAKEAGCAPMTIYAHFEGKTDILRHLWADVLREMSVEIQKELKSIAVPIDRLHRAAQSFVSYWIDHPDNFRLVFMSTDVTRSDVDTFMTDDKTLAHFKMFFDLIQDVLPNDDSVKIKTDALISGMIGIALCINTIADYPWANSTMMTDRILASIINENNSAKT